MILQQWSSSVKKEPSCDDRNFLYTKHLVNLFNVVNVHEFIDKKSVLRRRSVQGLTWSWLSDIQMIWRQYLQRIVSFAFFHVGLTQRPVSFPNQLLHSHS